MYNLDLPIESVNLYNPGLFRKQMFTVSKQTTREIDKMNSMAIGVLITVLLFGIYAVGYDQGQLFSLVQGQKAFDIKWMHEFSHDIRHAAGFPCH